jgi:hypothetical protein
MRLKWSDVRPGDAIVRGDVEWIVKRVDVSSGVVTLEDARGELFPGRPNMQSYAEVIRHERFASAEALVAEVFNAQPIAEVECPACGHRYSH